MLARLDATIYGSPILIVDDSELNRSMLEAMLRKSGFNSLRSVASGEDALLELDKFKPEMIILDVMMPSGMDGLTCCEAIRKQQGYSDLPILIQTAATQIEMRARAFASGATDFISKPVYPDELCARALVHLQKRQALKSLQRYKARIENELESARKLQQAIIPTPQELREIEMRSNIEIAAHFNPSSEVGGDFWGIRNLSPHQTALWLVDFSGHGVASALNAFRLQAYIKEHSTIAMRPGEYLASLNDKLLHLLLRGQFATMFYGILDTRGGKLFYACACTPHPILWRRSTGKAQMIDGSGSPLGLAMQLYSTQSTMFDSGDVLLLYSDALIETRNQNGESIAESVLIALLEQYASESAEEIRQKILDYFTQHTDEGEVIDDLTLVVCKRS